MLTWDNFEFVENTTGNNCLESLPTFPIVDSLSERTLEESLEKADRMYCMLLNALVREAVVNNRFYAPRGSIDPDLKVWDVPCKKNDLPEVKGMLRGELVNFRAATDAVVKVVTTKPLTQPSERKWENYKGHFWYQVNGDSVEYELSAAIAKSTDQSKLGKV